MKNAEPFSKLSINLPLWSNYFNTTFWIFGRKTLKSRGPSTVTWCIPKVHKGTCKNSPAI
jgi:hypothetical protein